MSTWNLPPGVTTNDPHISGEDYESLPPAGDCAACEGMGVVWDTCDYSGELTEYLCPKCKGTGNLPNDD